MASNAAPQSSIKIQMSEKLIYVGECTKCALSYVLALYLAPAATQNSLSTVAALISLRKNKFAYDSSERLHTQVTQAPQAKKVSKHTHTQTNVFLSIFSKASLFCWGECVEMRIDNVRLPKTRNSCENIFKSVYR